MTDSTASPVSVVCAANGPFAMPLGVMMCSLLIHRNPERPVTFYIFDSDLPSPDRARLEAVASGDGVSLVWLQADHSRLQGLPRARSLSVYDRLLIGEHLPASVSKAIWLDADLLILRDIGELWSVEPRDHVVLAVQDMAIPYVACPLGLGEWRTLGLPAGAPYFNSGVLVIDLNTWRREELGARAIEYLRSRKRRVATYDQESLNVVLRGRWGVLDPRWNLIASLAGRRFHKSPHLSTETSRRTVEDPWILHFAGDWKPWTLPRGRHSYDLYFRYLDATPWSGWRPGTSLSGSLRALYHDHLRETLYPLETLFTALRFGRLPEYLRPVDR
jgi:lipopolysaccharide biosynthesis glycosyltransferase